LFAARNRVEQAKARVRQARAAYWPSLDASASYSETWLSDGQIDSQRWLDPSPDDSPETYQAGLEAGWLLFDGFGRRFQNAAARFGVEESEASHREARRLLAAAVAGSFFAAQLARENIAIAEANEAFNQRQLQEARVRRRVGTGSLSDELNFEIRVNEARAIRFDLDYRIAWRSSDWRS
jgi:outer membrane protein TolC